jgi:2-polyprenyl-3-methyl-5-hydroxy-6-metoxy-1,4-benzoquinol methylase
MVDFDREALQYRQVTNEAIQLSGYGVDDFARHKADLLLRRLGSGFQGKILDFGCGIGLLSDLLHRRLPQGTIHGYDVSERSLDQVPRALRSVGHFTSDLASLDKDYDLILLANVIHHILPINRHPILSLLRERLSPTGELAVFEHNPLNPLTRWVVRHCPYDADAVLLPLRETRQRLLQAGLMVRTTAYVVFFPRWLSWLSCCEPYLAGCPLGAQYVCIAQRDTEKAPYRTNIR